MKLVLEIVNTKTKEKHIKEIRLKKDMTYEYLHSLVEKIQSENEIVVSYEVIDS